MPARNKVRLYLFEGPVRMFSVSLSYYVTVEFIKSKEVTLGNSCFVHDERSCPL